MTLVVYQGSTHRNIQDNKAVNIHNIIEAVTFSKILQEIFNLIIKLICNGIV